MTWVKTGNKPTLEASCLPVGTRVRWNIDSISKSAESTIMGYIYTMGEPDYIILTFDGYPLRILREWVYEYLT